MDQLSGNQVAEWQAVNEIDPIGERREDWRMANIIAWMFNIVKMIYASKQDMRQPGFFVAPDKFMLQWGREEQTAEEQQQQSIDEMKAALFSYVGKVKD